MWSSDKPTERPRETKRLTDAAVKPHVEGPTCDLVRFPAGQRSEWGVCVVLRYLRRWKHPLSRTSAETKLVQSLSNFSSSSAWSAMSSNTHWLTHSLSRRSVSGVNEPLPHTSLPPHPATLKRQQELSSHNTENKSHPGVWGRPEKLFGHWNKTNWTVFLIT